MLRYLFAIKTEQLINKVSV